MVRVVIDVPQWIASAIAEVMQFLSDPTGRPDGPDCAVAICAAFASCHGRTSLAGSRCKTDPHPSMPAGQVVHAAGHIQHALGAVAGCAEGAAKEAYARLGAWSQGKEPSIIEYIHHVTGCSFKKAADATAASKSARAGGSYEDIRTAIHRRPPEPPAIEGDSTH